MSDLVPEEAIERAARASFSRVGSTGRFDDLPSAHRDGWLASARSGLEAAAPLILAAELDRLGDQLAEVRDAMRQEDGRTLRSSALGEGIRAIRARASVLREEGDPK